jgi:L-fuculose-phosphate aldolase
MQAYVENKADLLRREQERMQRELSGGSWSVKERLVLACRILHAHGHESGLAGQITARHGAGEFYTQQLGRGLAEARPSDLLRVDESLSVVEGAGMPNPANRFHGWVYRARPDVQCIVHTHPPYCSALSMLGIPLVIAHMDSCALYDDVGFVDHWPGVPIGDEEGRLISTGLGNKSALLLAHHGVVAVGRNVEEACVLALQLERAATLQILAGRAGAIRPIERQLGLQARDWLRTPRRTEVTFAYYARRELSKDAQCLD